jgi:hypothetical protein
MPFSDEGMTKRDKKNAEKDTRKDTDFSINNFSARDTLADIPSLSFHPQLKKSQCLNFYHKGLRLNEDLKICRIIKDFQKKEESEPIIIYTDSLYL